MKSAHYKTGSRDANEHEFMEFLTRRNVKYTQFKPGDGADLLIWISPMEVWEIKNPLQPKSKRELTDLEKEVQAYCVEAEIPYVVMEHIEQAVERLNLYFSIMDHHK